MRTGWFAHSRLWVCLVLLGTSAGCASVYQIPRSSELDTRAAWALLPIANHSESPNAGERAEDIVQSLLVAKGTMQLRRYPTPTDEAGLPELDEGKRLERAISWAKENGFAYGMTGSVTEWSYRPGLDGEPAVGVTLQVVEVSTGKIAWAATGAKTGWGRESVSATAQKVISQLLDGLGR